MEEKVRVDTATATTPGGMKQSSIVRPKAGTAGIVAANTTQQKVEKDPPRGIVTKELGECTCRKVETRATAAPKDKAEGKARVKTGAARAALWWVKASHLETTE